MDRRRCSKHIKGKDVNTIEGLTIASIFGIVPGSVFMLVSVVWIFLTPWEINLKKAENERERLEVEGEYENAVHMFWLGFFAYMMSMTVFIFS